MKKLSRWRPSRAVRNFMALHSLRWRRAQGDYDDFDVEVYRVLEYSLDYHQRIAHLMVGIQDRGLCWTDERIISEIEWGLEQNNGS